MGTRSVEAEQGVMPVIAHASTGIVHGLPRLRGSIEKVPFESSAAHYKSRESRELQRDILVAIAVINR
jgi:hypothetical protein